jgi:hypothetical protein
MILIAQIFVGAALLILVLQVIQLVRVEMLRKEFDAGISDDAVELDPVEDALLFGVHHWFRLSLFDLWQKKILKISRGLFKKRNKPEHELTELQAVLLDGISKESSGTACGKLVEDLSDEPIVKGPLEKAEAKYTELQLFYPDNCTYGTLMPTLGKVSVIAALILLPIILYTGHYLYLPLVFLPPLGTSILMKTKVQKMVPYTERGQRSIALMREKWAGKKMKRKKTVDPENEAMNVAILGAMGMVALERTSFHSFADTMPSVVSSSTTTSMTAGGCGHSSCSSCSSCGGGGGGGGCGSSCGGGGCGGGCGG